MYKRNLTVSTKRSFFLFGARGTGKSTLLESTLSKDQALFIDLLDPGLYSELQAYPEKLLPIISDAIDKEKVIVIDEVQRVPALLDIAHQLIQKKKAIFALTGSSARKLKRGSANMLAGRASVYNLYPLLYTELEDDFNLKAALEWGTLPELFSINERDEKLRFLQAYTETYINQEIIAEQIIRKLPPFRRFLNVAAQMNGKIINASKIAADVKTDPSNIQNYFEILEDTLVGFKLEAYHSSIRKRQRQKPKFYWFDTGVVRCLQKQVDLELRPSTSVYGDIFESFIISQIKTGLQYQVSQSSLSYLMTKEGAEIDLIVERSGKETLCIEIKSSTSIREQDLTNLIKLSRDINNSKAVCLYNGDRRLSIGSVDIIPWMDGLIELELVNRG